MNKKIICIGIISMFLLASLTTLSTVGIKIEAEEILNAEDGETPPGWTMLVSTESTRNSEYPPSLDVGLDGTVHVTWQDCTDYDNSGEDWDIFYKNKPSGESWTITEVVSTESTADPVTSSIPRLGPSLAVDNFGTLHLVWGDKTEYDNSGSDRDIVYKFKPSGGDWSNLEIVSIESSRGSIQPFITVDSDRTVHVAWVEGGDDWDWDIYYKYKPYGGDWSNLEIVSTESTATALCPRLAIDNLGTVHITWADNTNYNDNDNYYDVVYKYKPSGGEWSDIEIVTASRSGLENSLDVDFEGTVHVAWQDTTSSSKICYKYKPRDGEWSKPELVHANTIWYLDFSKQPSLVVDYDGTVHVAFHGFVPLYPPDSSAGNYRIFYTIKPKDGSWGDIELVSTEHESYFWSEKVSIDIESDGTMHAVWQDLASSLNSGFDWDIFYRQKKYGNQLPNKPSKPSGPRFVKRGNEYTYTCSATDPNEDQLYYKFWWGDGTYTYWLGPYDSGETVEAIHQWTKKGTYDIEVKVKDMHGDESLLWSDPLSVSMPRNRAINTPLFNFLQQHPILFQLLQRFLKL